MLNKGEHIKGSPFVVMIDPERKGERGGPKGRIIPSDASTDALRVGEPFQFFVECESFEEEVVSRRIAVRGRRRNWDEQPVQISTLMKGFPDV